MMGCHFQELPCKVSLCLRDLHSGREGPHFTICDESTAIVCPHRAWEHRMHLDVCSTRAEVIDHCSVCGGRHHSMIEALRCELASSVQRAFMEEDENELIKVTEKLPMAMRANAWCMIRKGVIARDGGRCKLCGKDLSYAPSWLTEVHHVRPRGEGGSDHPSNLITLCVMCHRKITTEALLSGARSSVSSYEFLPRECLEAFR